MKTPRKKGPAPVARKAAVRKDSQSSSKQKLQRWMDLLVALLRHRAPAEFAEILHIVPAYKAEFDRNHEEISPTLKRMFERDKMELIQLGIPLESISNAGEEHFRYRLRPADFYLPYLGIVTARGVQKPKSVRERSNRSPYVDGYQFLSSLVFEPDELEAIADGGRNVAQAGDPALADDAKSALRKLAFDLPLDATGHTADELLVPPRHGADPETLSALGDALFRRKRVTFHYHGAGAEKGADRIAEPYGLFFLNGHWYLVARDTSKEGLRNFRVSRMTDVRPNTSKPLSSDYTIPSAFNLREHARSRQAWEIGDGDAYEAIVEFRGETGATVAAAALGTADPSTPSLRRFHVRRTDSFARWLLTFADEARPVAPPALVDSYREVVAETKALYRRAASHD